MKLKNIHFLSKANLRKNRRKYFTVILMVALVVSGTVIPGFLSTLTNAVSIYKQDFRARALELDPWKKELTDDVIQSIKGIDHVEDVFELKGMRSQYFDITGVSDENGVDKKLEKDFSDKGSNVEIWSLIGNEKRGVISGKTLAETPEFSCIIPNLFYPNVDESESENLDYINGETLIGKTLTVKPDEVYERPYNFYSEYGGGNEMVELPALEYKLKIVGVYYAPSASFGDFDRVFVSEETGRLIEKMAFEASGLDLKSKNDNIAKWYNTPSLRTHYVIVDNFENIEYVYNQISAMNVECANEPEAGMRDENALFISDLLSSIGLFFIFATIVLSVINLIQLTVSSLKKRKAEIGLLKAVGYKNSQIFSCLFYEQLSLTFKGFFIGGIISAIVIAGANFRNLHATFASRLYIVSWTDFFIFLFISLAIAIIVPLICELIGLFKLTKIQPRDAMN